MKTYHITWATKGRQPAFPTEEARRAVLHAIASVAGTFIVLFAIVDDHVHIVLRMDAARLAAIQASLTRVLINRAAVELAPPYVRDVATRAHMSNLVGYCLGQFEHHGLADDPATATGSCFPDLVGARRIPELSLPITAALPRFRQRDAYAAVGLDAKLVPADDATVRGLGPARLAEAVAHTFGLAADLAGERPQAVRARRTLARLAYDVGLRPNDVAIALGITPTAAARLRNRRVDELDVRAIRLRIALEAAAARPAAARLAERIDASAPNVVREPPPPPYLVEPPPLQPIMHRVLGEQRVAFGA
ncbi:hypothetical protein LBMAG42_44850 [Deltaproteobacteria bacterium]|nr:hypothetical protein LBMAG42_44850 [Deltaproteobacteria bacterium]